MVVGVEEVGMVGKPAESKHNQHNDEHLGQLKICNYDDDCDGTEMEKLRKKKLICIKYLEEMVQINLAI